MDERKTFSIFVYVVDKTAASNRAGLELESSFGLRKRMVITTTKEKSNRNSCQNLDLPVRFVRISPTHSIYPSNRHQVGAFERVEESLKLNFGS